MSQRHQAQALADDTQRVAEYLASKFNCLRGLGCKRDLVVPAGWSLDYLIEVDLAANVMLRAFRNRSNTSG
jgi:hypothetical protein